MPTDTLQIAPDVFKNTFAEYVDAAKRARSSDRAERQLSHLFTGMMQKAFAVEAEAFTLEQHIQLTSVRRHGYIDALFGDVVFEFKKDIRDRKREIQKYRDQLRDYLRDLPDGETYIGMLTDGLKFEVYSLRDDALYEIETFDLETLDAEAAYIRLDTYLFSQKNAKPTAADVVGRFGAQSPTFRIAIQQLRELFTRVADVKMLAVWRDQWRRLLSKVYGHDDAGNDEMFLRHTYLCQFARLLAYAAIRDEIPPDDETVKRIITGEAFQGDIAGNIGERDFFSWLLMDEIDEDAVQLFRRIGDGLIAYDLSRIDQDLLKQLYQNLVDTETRHDLGEYYTPDWLAELTLESINYHSGQSLLDPACGSGSFLFAAIKRLEAQGLTGWRLVEFATENIMGMDVHPLAITIARLNMLLALAEHMKDTHGKSGLVNMPVYMADALIQPLSNRSHDALIVPVDDQQKEVFRIPIAAAKNAEALTSIIESMYEYARRAPKQPDIKSFNRQVLAAYGDELEEGTRAQWTNNLRLLARLIDEGRNGIWSYILTNLSRPLVLAERQFDVVAGNPPWLPYGDIQSKSYQRDVKALYQHYKLIESGDVNLFTQMDLSTLFFALARDRYLKPKGTLAFVLPRAVITGAKQHRPFQKQPLTRAIDLSGVQPLFSVPTCVLIYEGSVANNSTNRTIPSQHYTGRLRAHEMTLEDARGQLKDQAKQVMFVDSDVRGSYYYERFRQGATLVPRNLCFVKPEGSPNSPAVITDPDANKEAKKPYKGVVLRGMVDDDYLYATLLSKHLVPFGYEKLHLVALPTRMDSEGRLTILETEVAFLDRGHFTSADWFTAAAAKWDALKKKTTRETFPEYLNYQGKLVVQKPQSKFKVMYASSGSNLASCAMVNDHRRVNERKVMGMVIDHATYWYDTNSLEEAYYLAGILNTPIVNEAIKLYQPRGSFGERHIHRIPFEACAIPPFDTNNGDHIAIVKLSEKAHQEVMDLQKRRAYKGNVVAIRKQARKAAEHQIAAIDVIARRVLGMDES